MKVLDSVLRAIVERVTELEWHHKGNRLRLWVFEHLGQKGEPVHQWIQNWYTDDITDTFDREEQNEIFEAVNKFHRQH